MWITFLKPQMSIDSGQFPVRTFTFIMSENFRKNYDKNDEKMNDLKSIQNHFREVPVPPGHQKT